MSVPNAQEILRVFSDASDARMDGELQPLPVPKACAAYHYTDAAGLKGIIEKDAIWLTERVHLNDPTELTYGLKFALDWCDKQLETGDRLGSTFFGLLRRGLDSIPPVIAAYVSSFSLAYDVLSQWCRYSDDGRGFCLEFSPDFLENQRTDYSGPGGLYAYVVDYRESEIKDRQESCLARAHEYMKRPDIKRAVSQEHSPREFIVGMQNAITYELIWNALQFKHPAYSDEREVRILLTGDPANLRTCAMHKTRVRRNELVSYVEFPFSPSILTAGLLRRVIVGPAASRESVASAEALLQSAHLGQVEVIQSSIPYRSMRQ